MKTTYLTTMKSEAGTFLRASRIIAQEGGNITRVNYNKSVDEHTLFIDVESGADTLKRIGERLGEEGFLPDAVQHANVILIEFKIPDEPGKLVPILDIIGKYNINITYINSEENGTPYQYFKMGLFITDAAVMKKLLDEVSAYCETRIIEYEPTEKLLDNTVFYLSFASDIASEMKLDKDDTNALIVESNKIMQMLDEKNEQPYKTFDYINRFADTIASCKGDNFKARVSKEILPDGAALHIIEPPCGSNIYVFDFGEKLLFIDSGFSCYREETLRILRLKINGFDSRPKEMILTHPDTDHVGIYDIFDKVYMSFDSYRCFELQADGKDDYREQNPAHAPYSRICKILTGYKAPKADNFEKFVKVNNKTQKELIPLERIGRVETAGRSFVILAGSGGHVQGEVIILSENYPLVFSGDVFVNIKGFTNEQYEFNTLAPYLMTNVDTDSEKAKAFRDEFFDYIADKNLTVCGGHGAVYPLFFSQKKRG